MSNPTAGVPRGVKAGLVTVGAAPASTTVENGSAPAAAEATPASTTVENGSAPAAAEATPASTTVENRSAPAAAEATPAPVGRSSAAVVARRDQRAVQPKWWTVVGAGRAVARLASVIAASGRRSAREGSSARLRSGRSVRRKDIPTAARRPRRGISRPAMNLGSRMRLRREAPPLRITGRAVGSGLHWPRRKA